MAKDVCDILEIVNYRDAMTRLDDDEKGVVSTDTLGGTQEMLIVNESGLYALVLTSRKPEARKFRKWVTSEVLPAIRKTGRYEARPVPSDRAMRAEAQLRNAQGRQARLLLLAANEYRDILSLEAVQLLVSKAVEIAAGQPVLPLPAIDKDYTAEEIGRECGLTANKIGRIANRYGIKTGEYGHYVLDKSPYSNKQVTTFRYNEMGRAKLLELADDEKSK
ncbi:Bro-N domain-containing protein [Candidatus Igneacidithiobacillus taiwanensis]|uniref:BRO-N domain-containing protein n=1 Tax=Candidatus Igneacidithiobacillus taiwanensis TaxID=1945924 RepID=UPI0039170589